VYDLSTRAEPFRRWSPGSRSSHGEASHGYDQRRFLRASIRSNRPAVAGRRRHASLAADRGCLHPTANEMRRLPVRRFPYDRASIPSNSRSSRLPWSARSKRALPSLGDAAKLLNRLARCLGRERGARCFALGRCGGRVDSLVRSGRLSRGHD
jgi:hypothetical protein